jgi:hypothetical protein
MSVSQPKRIPKYHFPSPSPLPAQGKIKKGEEEGEGGKSGYNGSIKSKFSWESESSTSDT